VRDISTHLRDHLHDDTTTTCRLLKFVLTNGNTYGMTTLDSDITYDGTTYHAINGFDPSNIATDAGLTVDNSEVRALISADISGITVAMVKAGQMDDATWEMLLVNYRDLSMGHVVIDGGDVGEVRVVDGVVYMPELVSSVMRLRQAVGHVWSRSCRAIFGSPTESQTGCGVDAESLWMAGTVTGLGDEDRRIFSDSSLLALAPEPIPGRVQWLTGSNTSSRVYQIEAYGDTTGTIGLLEPCAFDIVVGDTFRLRVDCDKQPSTCKNQWNNWLNYKGEPLIPVGDGVQILTPSAQIAGGFVGSEVI